MTEKLLTAQKKQEELIKKINASESIKQQRPLFHFAVPGGWCNDPNGFSIFKGKIHLFYQYHPYSTHWGPMYWGHVTTSDFLNWDQEPVAFAPDTEFDNRGCFSGTAIEDDNKHIIAYTGVREDNDKEEQVQCIAIGDGKEYEKLSINPVISKKNIPFDYYTEHFRDPKIWKKGNLFYMLCGIKLSNKTGALILFESENLKNWKYKGLVDSSKNGFSEMWECPDCLTLNEKNVLIISAQGIKEDYELGFNEGNNTLYVTGEFDYKNCFFSREIRPENGYTAAKIDYGIDFYAPETIKLNDGRIIMIAWMQAWESYNTPENYIWSGMMTIPRELSFRNGRLYQMPVRELDNLKKDIKSGSILPERNKCILQKKERHFELDLNLKDEGHGIINFFVGKTDDEYILLEINLSENNLKFDRTHSLKTGKISHCCAKLRTGKQLKKIKIICDTCSLEVFIDDGIMTFSNTFYLSDIETDLIIENGSSIELDYECCELQLNR